MERSLDPSDLIVLPRLSAHAALSLARSLASATQDENNKPIKLSEPVKAALDDMLVQGEALAGAIGAKPAQAPAVREADILEDMAVGALADVLRGWARLAGQIPEGDVARDLDRRLFGDGLLFLNSKPIEEHAAVESRLQVIETEGLDKAIAQLGGAPLLKHLKKVHQQYGKVTGATRALAAPDSPEIREKLDDLLSSIRHYAGAVIGSVVRKKPETQKLADKLLLPLTTWKSAKPKSKAAPPEGGAQADG